MMNGLKGATVELVGVSDELQALREIVEALPKCRPWVGGSGGHKKFGKCPRIATWSDIEDPDIISVEWYCDEHLPEHRNYAFDFKELWWAEAVRKAGL